MFIVIEGDNGSGKTTLGKFFENCGFYNVTEDKLMKKLEFNAKKLPIKTEERIESFLAYNFKCGKKSEEFQNALLIRYWISTLAAAYSDEILSKQEVLDRLGKITKTFRILHIPNFVVSIILDIMENFSNISFIA